MPTTTHDRTLAAAELAANQLEPHVRDDPGVHLLGMLAPAASVTATVAYDYDRAQHWLDQAERPAERTPDAPGENRGAFSASNVGSWRVALATQRGETGRDLLDLAGRVDERELAPAGDATPLSSPTWDAASPATAGPGKKHSAGCCAPRRAGPTRSATPRRWKIPSP
ncbi:hypothetical protein E1293_36395 [Actinomadura darangshiensis]|uniref:Uncharacterized protein n=1 Tax=Actinomadura darangshiensis TaxID=705336 RepID=A0A4R5ACM4_9ACTN|nr:hypothetical protein [Actinomadura darangshiensis]TDD68990.1 hypothetical protein E1293_36395 [Actinomadura darangshiensis]